MTVRQSDHDDVCARCRIVRSLQRTVIPEKELSRDEGAADWSKARGETKEPSDWTGR
jgi:hypothetical protein